MLDWVLRMKSGGWRWESFMDCSWLRNSVYSELQYVGPYFGVWLKCSQNQVTVSVACLGEWNIIHTCSCKDKDWGGTFQLRSLLSVSVPESPKGLPLSLSTGRRPLAFKKCLTNIDFSQASKEDKLVPGFLGPVVISGQLSWSVKSESDLHVAQEKKTNCGLQVVFLIYYAAVQTVDNCKICCCFLLKVVSP